MHVVSYCLLKGKKPFFMVTINGIAITCLYDTGAISAVWCGEEELFERVFPNRELLTSKYSLGGFGGLDRSLVDIYRVDGFRLRSVEFPRFPVATQFNRNFGCQLILGNSLTVHADIIIRHVEERSINFLFEDSKYYSHLEVNKSDGTVIEDSYVLVNESDDKDSERSNL